VGVSVEEDVIIKEAESLLTEKEEWLGALVTVV